MTESDIIKGCIRQDRASQKALYEQNYRKMLGVCLRYAKSIDEAKDILQDGFLKVFTNIRSFTGSGSFEGWIRRIMVNTAIDYLRKNKHEYWVVSTVHIKSDHVEKDEEDLSEDELLNRIDREDIIKAVQELTPAYRAVFNLYVIDEYTHKEISEILGISEGTSKSNLAKAKHNLRKNLLNSIRTHHDRQ